MSAHERGEELVTLCSACHNVLKQTNYMMRTDAASAAKVNAYLKPEVPYAGEATVLHFLEVLRDRVGFEELAKKVVKPLTGRKIAAYYGCLLLRPGKVMAMDDPENPRILEDFIRAIGAEPVMDSAAAKGADTVVTACPLCLYNLKKNGAHEELPVVYFTELLAEALGVK